MFSLFAETEEKRGVFGCVECVFCVCGHGDEDAGLHLDWFSVENECSVSFENEDNAVFAAGMRVKIGAFCHAHERVMSFWCFE